MVRIEIWQGLTTNHVSGTTPLCILELLFTKEINNAMYHCFSSYFARLYLPVLVSSQTIKMKI